MDIVKLGSLLLAGALSIAAMPSIASAASPITNALVSNVKANLDFLDRSSALAAERSKSDAVRTYAQAEKTEAVQTAQALTNNLAGQPVELASAEDAGALMTGRSVAIDGPNAGPGQAANGRAPMGPSDLEHLAKLSGKKFNNAFWLKQLDALSQLRADYQAYLDDGDDATLIAMAKRELPAVEQRMAALAKI